MLCIRWFANETEKERAKKYKKKGIHQTTPILGILANYSLSARIAYVRKA